MSSDYKPNGYPSASPYLIVPDGAATIDFLVRAFGGVELRRFDDEGGRIVHAEVRIGDGVIMLGGANESWPPQPAHVHLYVPDVDAAYRSALDAGATSLQEPVRKEDEDKRGGVLDPGGTTWWIATRVG